MRLRMSKAMSAPEELLGPVEIYDETTGSVLVFDSLYAVEHYGLTGDPGNAVTRPATGAEVFEVSLADLLVA